MRCVIKGCSNILLLQIPLISFSQRTVWGASLPVGWDTTDARDFRAMHILCMSADEGSQTDFILGIPLMCQNLTWA